MTSISAPTASTTEVIGHFDYVEDGRAYGWAFAPAHPQKRLAVDIISNGEVIAHGYAENFREDLRDAGIGDGGFMFNLQLSNELFDGQLYSLTAREAETGTALNGGTREFGPEIRELSYPQIPRSLGLELLAGELNQTRHSQYSNKLSNFAAAYRLASRLQETGHLIEARSAWVAINNTLGENSIGYCKLGECLLLEGSAAEALGAFRIAAGCDLRLHWVHLGIANSQYTLGRFKEAEEALEVAIALQPQNTGLQEHLHYIQSQGLPQRVETLIAQHNRNEAVDLLKSLLLRQPENSQAYALLGDLLSQPGETSLRGTAQLNQFRMAQRILDALLDDVESRLKETPSQ